MISKHCEKLQMVLAHYDECEGKLNPNRCHSRQPRVKLLGHAVSENGIEADSNKVKLIILLPLPRQLQSI